MTAGWPSRYACAPDLGGAHGQYEMRPLAWADREPIRRWRNEQIDVLRQRGPLTQADQDRYYLDVVAPQFGRAEPAQVLVAVEFDGVLIGYGGVVHLAWGDRRGEVSFLTDTGRLDAQTFAADWRAYLAMLVPAARDQIGLHKLTTETYAVRTGLFPLLEEAGFVQEGTLREHHDLDGTWVDSIAHGLLL